MELTSINQKIETSRQLYSILLQYQKKLEIGSIDHGANVSLVSPAVRPQHLATVARRFEWREESLVVKVLSDEVLVYDFERQTIPSGPPSGVPSRQ